jgi:integrase/recombinase XerD
MLTTTAIILDTRRAKQDGSYPVKLRITYQRKRKYYSTGFDLTEEDFQKVYGSRPRQEFKELQLRFNTMEKRAADIIKDLPEFTFGAFEKKYLGQTQVEQDVYSLYDHYIKMLSKEGRVGTASSYSCSLKSLKSFHARKLYFDKVTPEFLKEYERWMVAEGNSLTTVGIYLRALRTICNLGIEKGAIDQQAYPFGKRKYQIPAGRNIKKALTLDDIKKIMDYQTQSDTERWSRDIWIFSYLCNGINIKDIARLKYSNIGKDKITFIRAKTERTSIKNLKPIVAMLTPEALHVISRWGKTPAHPDAYVFGILVDGVTPERERALVQQATKTINKYVKKIATAVGIDKDVTTYTARHSFSTILKRSGAPIEFISESLGHHDLKTTEHYLDSFEDDVKKKYAGLLTDFKK